VPAGALLRLEREHRLLPLLGRERAEKACCSARHARGDGIGGERGDREQEEPEGDRRQQARRAHHVVLSEPVLANYRGRRAGFVHGLPSSRRTALAARRHLRDKCGGGGLMAQRWSRRAFVGLTSGISALGVSALATRAWGQSPAPPPSFASEVFPAQDPALVKEVVGVSHRDLKRVQELVERQPALARASIDWGFGDWEACIDAASHVGNKPIAEFLLTHGARPTIFSAAMMGQLDVVKAFVAARPGVQRTPGPHGLTLMWHARQGGPDSAAVVQYLTSVGDADLQPATVSLADPDRDAVVGKYTYGSGPRDFFTVEVRRDMSGRDQLVIERPGAPTRHNLYHLGDLVFFPTGVPNAKIAFARAGTKITQLTVADPNVMLTARRD
jgi:hypothetical protein